MSIYKDRSIAIQDLDFLIDSIETATSGRARKDRKKGFDNRQILFMIMAWTKITIRAEISGDTGWYTWLSKREPSSLAGTHLKRSEALVLALQHYQSALESDSDVSSYYHRAADAMMNFVWDYRQHIIDDVDRDTEYVNSITPMMSKGLDQFMEIPVFPSEQGI
jgi:hypothetical protein